MLHEVRQPELVIIFQYGNRYSPVHLWLSFLEARLADIIELRPVGRRPILTLGSTGITCSMLICARPAERSDNKPAMDKQNFLNIILFFRERKFIGMTLLDKIKTSLLDERRF